MPEGTASRAALLALRLERHVIEDGHGFLDEKRMALAHELLRRTRQYLEIRSEFVREAAQGVEALAAAIRRHGLEGLQVHPPNRVDAATVDRSDVMFLGLHLIASLSLTLESNPRGEDGETLEGLRCAQQFERLATLAVSLAQSSANLLRLMREYRRTERRVRALENVVLPEIRSDERRFETALEELDQEEVIRARLFAHGS